ncbi:P2Y purinoceptor 4-like [Odontesthes bonariensis]|uniref:P2Y purinoceptor 4-like n=1 Tax=Odontesthes bonariensis TaxID=219752 RepID=UPI003F58D29D
MSTGSSSNTSSLEMDTDSTICIPPWYLFAVVVVTVPCLFGIPANISVIVKLSRHLRGSTMSQRLFFNLALSDLLCLFCLLAGGIILLTELNSTLHSTLCQVLFYLFFFSLNSSLNILVLISFQRYYQILHHAKWAKVNRTWQRILLFSVWMLAALLALPPVFSLTEVKRETEQPSCKSKRVTPEVEVIYIVYTVSCHLLLLFFCVLLVRGVKRLKMCDKKKRSVTKLFSRIIAVSLIVSFLPLMARVIYVTARLTESKNLLNVSKWITFIECFYFTNHCLNPWLYFFASLKQKREPNSERGHFLMPLDDSC